LKTKHLQKKEAVPTDGTASFLSGG
jgi:hypothetical protein